MKNTVTIVENARPAYVAAPVTDGDKVVEICLEPIVAWKIVYESGDESTDYSDIASGIPITIHSGLPEKYAVYYSDTDVWSISEVTSNKGIDNLIKYFQDTINEEKG